MSMTMGSIAIVVACLASVVCGLRIQPADGRNSRDNLDADHALKLLELLLPAHSPAAAWSSSGLHASAGRPQHALSDSMTRSRLSLAPRLSEVLEATEDVTSWYDSGIRLEPETPVEAEEVVPEAGEEEVTSWYDSGIRLVSEMPAVEEEAKQAEDSDISLDSQEDAPLAEVEESKEEPSAAQIEASTAASLAAALISATAVLGLDLAVFGGIENLEVALLTGGLVLSQVDQAGPLGATLRTVGNVSSVVASEVVVPTGKAVGKYWVENEVGLKLRAGLELGLQKAFYSLSPEAREAAEREAAELRAAQERKRAEEEAARQEAERQEYKDSLPFWSPEKYFD